MEEIVEEAVTVEVFEADLGVGLVVLEVVEVGYKSHGEGTAKGYFTDF